MPLHGRARWAASGTALLTALGLVSVGSAASAAPASSTGIPAAGATVAQTTSTAAGGTSSGGTSGPSDLTKTGTDFNEGKALPLDKRASAKAVAAAKAAKQPTTSATGSRKAATRPGALKAANAVVGEHKAWPSLDDTTNRIALKNYTLRGLGNNIQVWVADDRAFPAGDCRNDLGLTNITDAQVNSFVHEFDTNIYPKESAAFSVPPKRDGGASAALATRLSLPSDYWTVQADQSDDIVVLVDNVRDENFYRPGSPAGQTYIAGFFYSVFNNLMDRNIMTIDAFDWLHRTGANPPNDSASPAYQACSQAHGSASSRAYGISRPHLYEGTFAHEYQHLLESYADPAELSWVNEGLSDYAQTLVGYVDPNIPPNNPKADGHLACFMGYLDQRFGGPENSLTQWSDQGPTEILCDYGAAYSFMEYLDGKYGAKALTMLHRDKGTGLKGLQDVLTQLGAKRTAQQTLHDWAAAMALDAQIGKRGVKGGSKSLLSVPTLTASINWDNPQAYSTPGAPPNGSDYVRLRDASGTPIAGSNLKSVAFTGDATLTAQPLQWTVAATPPAGAGELSCTSVPAGSGAAALYSGCGDNFDRAAIREVTVPTGKATLSFDALWDTEPGWDFGFVQVSTDGGATWTSLKTADTTSEHDAGAIPGVTANLPGFTGSSGGWLTQTADLSAYAGKKVLLSFRYVTDPGTSGAGFWVRNVHVGDTTIATDDLSGWKSLTQVSPVKVAGFTVQLVGYDSAGRAWYRNLPVKLTGPQKSCKKVTTVKVVVTTTKDKNGKSHTTKKRTKVTDTVCTAVPGSTTAFRAELSGKALRKVLDKKVTTIGAIVTYDDPTEGVTQYARYSLTANGVLQPGG